jgi:hypothetical protein
LLVNTKMPCQNSTELPGVGIQSRASLLVHKWDYLPGSGTAELAEKDDPM